MATTYNLVGDRQTTPTAPRKKPKEVLVSPVRVDYTLYYHYPDLDDTPVRGVSYRARMSDGEVRTGTLDDNGRATLRQIAPGPVRVEYQYDEPDTDDAAIVEAREKVQEVLDDIVAQTRRDMAAEWKQWNEAGEIERFLLTRGNAMRGSAIGTWNWASGTAESAWQMAVLVYKLDKEKRELSLLLMTGKWDEVDRRIAGYRAQGKKVLDVAGQLKELLILIWHDEKLRQIILKFPQQWWAAMPLDEQEAVAAAGGAEIIVDVLVGVLLAAFTAGVGGAAYASARWAIRSAKLGEKLVELLDALKEALQSLAKFLRLRKRKTVDLKPADKELVIETEWKPPPVSLPPGIEYGMVSGHKVFPENYSRLFHGADRSSLGFPTRMSLEEIAVEIYGKGLPARGDNIDILQHTRRVEDTAYRGTTALIESPVAETERGGAIYWAQEDGFVIELKNVKGYDVNKELQGRRDFFGQYRDNLMKGEQEIAVPGAISPDQIESISVVVKNARGNLVLKKLPRI